MMNLSYNILRWESNARKGNSLLPIHLELKYIMNGMLPNPPNPPLLKGGEGGFRIRNGGHRYDNLKKIKGLFGKEPSSIRSGCP